MNQEHQRGDSEPQLRRPNKFEAFFGKIGRLLRLTETPSPRDLEVKKFAVERGGDFGRDPDAPSQGFRAQIIEQGWPIKIYGWVASAGRGVPTEGVEFCLVARSNSSLRFLIEHSSLIDTVKEWVGVKDLQLGVPELDKAFHIKGTHADAIRSLLMKGDVAETLRTLPGAFTLDLVGNDRSRYALDSQHVELKLRYTGEVSAAMVGVYHRAFIGVIHALNADGQIS